MCCPKTETVYPHVDQPAYANTAQPCSTSWLGVIGILRGVVKDKPFALCERRVEKPAAPHPLKTMHASHSCRLSSE